MRARLALLGLVLAAAFAWATTYHATWTPSPNQSPSDPVITYELWACVGTALGCPGYDGSVAWHNVATFPASTACTTSPCAGTAGFNTSTSPVTFAMTALTQSGLRSGSSNVITKPPTASTTSTTTTSSATTTATTATVTTTRPGPPGNFTLS